MYMVVQDYVLYFIIRKKKHVGTPKKIVLLDGNIFRRSLVTPDDVDFSQHTRITKLFRKL